MKKIIAAVAAVALAVGLSAGTAGAAQSEHVLRPADVTHEDTRAAGHNEFRKDGVHVFTDDATSEAKATGYYDVGVALDSLSGVDQTWYGTAPQPGMQIVVDDPTTEAPTDGILVYEPVYNGDLWLTNGSSQALKDTAPSHEGGSGSDNHGTLAEWQAVTDLTVVKGGWSLGSGIQGDGVLYDQTYGDTTYTFTNQLPEAKPVASATITKPKATVAKVDVTATQPEGTVQTPRGQFYRVLQTKRGAAADGVIQPGEIVQSLAQGRIQADSHDRSKFTLRNGGKVTVLAKHVILADKAVAASK